MAWLSAESRCFAHSIVTNISVCSEMNFSSRVIEDVEGITVHSQGNIN